jgi:hypothetical protein
MSRRRFCSIWALAIFTVIARPDASAAQVDRDCRDFSTQQQAQTYFEARGGSAFNNVDNLDADGDGVACETLPGASVNLSSGNASLSRPS